MTDLDVHLHGRAAHRAVAVAHGEGHGVQAFLEVAVLHGERGEVIAGLEGRAGAVAEVPGDLMGVQ